MSHQTRIYEAKGTVTIHSLSHLNTPEYRFSLLAPNRKHFRDTSIDDYIEVRTTEGRCEI